MTLQEKIMRELGPEAKIEPAELNGREAIRVTHSEGAVFVIYAEAARVQIRHLDAYREACDARRVLSIDRGCGYRERLAKFQEVDDHWREGRMRKMYDSRGAKLAWRAIDHFASLSGFRLVEREAPKPE